MKVVFTSCMDATRVPVQAIWNQIHAEQPTVLMLMGDQIYMDWGLSSSKNPKWLRRFQKNPTKMLQEFGQDMYARYAAQWGVESFRNLIAGFVRKHGHDQLFLCWDDHDFAWNNACGMGLPENGAVPTQVKAVSKALFKQFSDHLRFGHASVVYPPYPNAHETHPTPGDAGIESFSPTPIDTVRIAMLDERWYRYPRDEIAAQGEFPSLLGPGQWAQLEAMLAHSTGLNIIAGGLPMKHRYRFSHQAWGAGPDGEAAYPDYARMLRVANKPTIFLAGDIHKNEWVGLVDQSKHLLHISSSGAAISNVLFVKFEPSYGVLDIDSIKKTVDVKLRSLQKTGWQYDLQASLKYSDQGWESATAAKLPSDQTLPAHATHYLEQALQYEREVADLSVLCVRMREKKLRYSPGPFSIDLIDDLYNDDEMTAALGGTLGSAYPEVLSIQAQSRQIQVLATSALQSINAVSDQMKAALRRAETGGKKALVLFVHGFNNTFQESVDQAYALRQLYPDIEPVLLSWPGGQVSKFLIDAGHDATLAIDNASHLPSSLVIALTALKTLDSEPSIQSKAIKRILALRSYGAQALQSWATTNAWTANHNDQLMNCIDSVVLSAPAIPIEQLSQWAGKLTKPVHVLVNRRDTTLRYGFKAVPKIWDAMGCNLPQGDAHANFNYFDCTDFSGVNKLHNIITTVVNEDVYRLHHQLLSGQFDPRALPQGFTKSQSTHSIWTKS